MNKLYIKFSLLLFFICLLSGSVLAQTPYKLGDPSPSSLVHTGDYFYDRGGASGDYTNNENGTITFTCAAGSVIRLTFDVFEVQDRYWSGNWRTGSYVYPDYLIAYDGSSASSSDKIDTYYGTSTANRFTTTNIPKVITSSGNSLTFSFTSSSSTTKSGWKAKIEVFDASEVFCYSQGSCLDYYYLKNVNVNNGGIDNSSTCDGYSDYTSITTDVEIGSEYQVSIESHNTGYYPVYYRLWVDWNHDGDFDDSNEEFDVPDNDSEVFSNVAVPLDAELGATRMRVKMMDTDNSDPCQSSSFYGEVEDYTLNVTPNLPDVSLSVGAASIDEDGGKTTVIVSLDVVLSENVVVGLSVGGDVTASDYSISSLSVTIPAGERSASIDFNAKNDDDIEGDEDAIIEIVSVSPNASENGTQEKTITIVDDEEPSQIQIPFEQRTSQNSPDKKIYNVKGDFTMIGNTNLTLDYYDDGRNNSNYNMEYVDVDSDATTFNSSSATLGFSDENGAKPACSHIIYAGLYWTGRGYNSNTNDFQVWNGSKYLDKREIRIKHAGESAYQEVTASSDDIYYPNGSESDIYAAYAEVTKYVQDHGIGEYFVADMALSEGNGGSTGYCGGWGLVVVYENSKMKWRDVTLYDGYAYVSHSGSGAYTSYDFPISGFKAVQSGDVNIKLGLMASEGDVGIAGDFMQIQNSAQNGWVSLTHDGNSTSNFFNSSIETGHNYRNPNLKNNTGVDISMFDVPNVGNVNIANGQTRTKFRYGTNQDAYAIFALAMAVDAYVPEAEATNAVMTIDGKPILDGSSVLPGQLIKYQLDIRNRGTEIVKDTRLVLPIPYTTDFVSSSQQVFFTPDNSSVSYDPTEGATGSIVWNIGDLPIPTGGPDEILGTLTYTLKVTEDCTILGNPDCNPSVAVGSGGGSSGTGATSGTTISGFSIIQGYQTAGECIGEPIVTPIEIQIDADAYVNDHCNVGEINSQQVYYFCNLGSSGSIPISEVSGNFPTGCRFYDDYPVIDGITEEFTSSNDFLADPGTRTYYAVPPGYTSCYYTFKITVKEIYSVPTANDVTYCEGDAALKLQASASDSEYKLFYYTLATDGTPQISIIPPTDIAGKTTYYVAEGESASCMSPNRKSIVVTVNPSPIVPAGDVSQSFCGSGTIADLVAISGSDDVNWYSSSTGGTILKNTDALSSGTYYAEGRNTTTGCVSSSRLLVNVSVNPLPIVPTGGVSQSFCGSGTIADLVATSGSDVVDWYSTSTGGTVLNNTNVLSGGTYYAEGRNATTGCVSSSRLLVNVSVNPLPIVPTGDVSQSFCGSVTIADLVATSGSDAVDWYSTSTGGTVLNNTNVLSSGTYYAEGRNATTGCVSSSRLLVNVSVNPLPIVPTGDISQSFCGSVTIADLVATSGSDAVDWYSISTGGIILNNTTTLSSGTYYAEGRNATTGCVSSSRLLVNVSVNPSVSVDVGSNQTICEGESATFTATPSPNGNYSYAWNVKGNATVIGTNQSLIVTPPGDPDINTNVFYEVTATDIVTACSSTADVKAVVKSNPTTTVTSVNPICHTLDSGSIIFTFRDHKNRSNIQFSINGSTGTYKNSVDDAGSYIFSGLVAGDYDVYVRWGNKECPLGLGIVTLELENISDMSFNYTESAYCSNELDPTPSIATPGGIFTSTDGLSIDSTTGVIDLRASTSGTYDVTYTIGGDCGGSSIQEVTINTSPKPLGIFFEN